MSESRQIPQIQTGERGLALRSIEDMWRLAQYAVASKIVPYGDTPEAVVIKLQAALELGLTPMRGLQSLYVVNGRIAMLEKLAGALVLSSGVLAPDGQVEVWYTGREFDDDYTCHVRSRRIGQNKPVETQFSVADAKQARLWGKTSDKGVSPWVAYPKRMLAARAKQHHYQDYYSDVTMGLPLAEVAEDDAAQVAAARPEQAYPQQTEPDPLFFGAVSTEEVDEP